MIQYCLTFYSWSGEQANVEQSDRYHSWHEMIRSCRNFITDRLIDYESNEQWVMKTLKQVKCLVNHQKDEQGRQPWYAINTFRTAPTAAFFNEEISASERPLFYSLLSHWVHDPVPLGRVCCQSFLWRFVAYTFHCYCQMPCDDRSDSWWRMELLRDT